MDAVTFKDYTYSCFYYVIGNFVPVKRKSTVVTIAWNKPLYFVMIWRGLFLFLLDLCSLLEHWEELGEILEKMKELGKTWRKTGLCHGPRYRVVVFSFFCFRVRCSMQQQKALSEPRK